MAFSIQKPQSSPWLILKQTPQPNLQYVIYMYVDNGRKRWYEFVSFTASSVLRKVHITLQILVLQRVYLKFLVRLLVTLGSKL